MSDPQRGFSERYELLGRLSRGPSGAVWCGRDLHTGAGCAIRMLEPGFAANAAGIHDLPGVLAHVRQLAHPNIVTVDDVVTGEGSTALVMPLISGESLAARLDRLGPLDPGEATSLVAQLCDALAAAHAAGLAHGRVKPSNIMLEPGADALLTVKLTDFGMAALEIPGVNDEPPTAAAAVSAAQYRAPELDSTAPATPEADLYATGVVLYETLAGYPPFTGAHCAEIARMHRDAPLPRIVGLPDAIWPLLTACLAKQPDLRPSAGVLASLLRDIAPSTAGGRVEPVWATPTVAEPAEPPLFEEHRPTVDPTAATASAAFTHRSLRGVLRTELAIAALLTALVGGAIAGFSNAGPRSHLPAAGSFARPAIGTTTGTPTTAAAVTATAPSAGRDTASGSPNAFATSPAPSALPGTAVTSTATTAASFPPAPSASASVVATSTAAGGSSSGGGTGALHAVGAGKCLDDPNSTTTLGTQQQIYSCWGGVNQTWTHTSARQLTVTVGGTTLCLDAFKKQTSAGTKVEIWACNGQTNQQWLLNSNGTVTGVQSGLCLAVTGASTANGALVELWTCDGSSSQHWTLG
jgi:hypothetical protein